MAKGITELISDFKILHPLAYDRIYQQGRADGEKAQLDKDDKYLRELSDIKSGCAEWIENHDAKVRANAIEEFAKWLEEKDYLNKTEIDYDWDEHSYLDIVSMAKEEILEEYMDWLATEKN